MSHCSLIIASYNRPDYLTLVMAGLERQTFKDYEIIIADDGSNEQTVSQIQQMISQSELPIHHVLQEDRGFRKNRILNLAIQQAKSDYLIFIDMDCIPHQEFIHEHVVNGREGICLTGRRVNLSDNISQRLSPDLVRNGYLENHLWQLICDGLFGHSKDVEKGIYLRLSWLREMLNRKTRGILGCNFSIFKKDILDINGFDERYEAPSVGEDTDIQYRLELNGIQIKSVNHMAIQYHLYHPLQPRPKENLELFGQVRKSGQAFTPFGILKTKGKG